ncbi:hypothetical protein [Natrinema longum]|uniref:Uncharacterized protein n=1 Tax=Natrinema longum TaxID=370324 RepID=A0A8A2UC36_9EURY|nr:hypothetical protein [Natrinema longum]MBZ6495865.1 hypothetical protein [Natrinema longum]QSW86193.1 hypothetical protein J0X27_05070 [Natrinema longum]
MPVLGPCDELAPRGAPRRPFEEFDRPDSPIGHDHTGIRHVPDRATVLCLGGPVEHAALEDEPRCPSVNARSRTGGHHRSV